MSLKLSDTFKIILRVWIFTSYQVASRYGWIGSRMAYHSSAEPPCQRARATRLAGK